MEQMYTNMHVQLNRCISEQILEVSNSIVVVGWVGGWVRVSE